MSGLPLNRELISRGARLIGPARTARAYSLYALPGGPPHRPGLVRSGKGGQAIELEVWALPQQAMGSFMAGVPAPLVIGTVELEDGQTVKGFLCENSGLQDAENISAHGGWRAYLIAQEPLPELVD